jgi:deoxycytidylate deaminase
MNKFLRIAVDNAKSHDYGPYLEFKLCAVLVSGGKVLSVGFNSQQFHKLTEIYRKNAYCSAMHAEIDAVVKARKKIRLEGSKIYVARILHGNNKMAMAKPCEMCQHVLFNYGVKKAIFTIDEFTSGHMKIHNPAEV